VLFSLRIPKEWFQTIHSWDHLTRVRPSPYMVRDKNLSEMHDYFLCVAYKLSMIARAPLPSSRPQGLLPFDNGNDP